MNRYLRILVSLFLIFTLALANRVPVVASGVLPDSFFISGYTVKNSSGRVVTEVRTGTKVNVEVVLLSKNKIVKANVHRAVDSFRDGEIDSVSDSGDKHTITIKNLVYKGSGNELGLVIKDNTDEYQTVTVRISECREYEPPTPSTPEAGLAPKVLFDCSGLSAPLEAGNSAKIKIKVKNLDKNTTIKSAVLTLSPQGELMIFGGEDIHYIKEIMPEKTAEVSLTITAADKLLSQSQIILASLAFDYYNNVRDEEGTAEGRITLPSVITPEPEPEKEEEKEEEIVIARPVPLIIMTGYDFGEDAVAAGEDRTISFTFKNTSKSISIENAVLTVSGGADLSISGSANTFYFDVIGPGQTKEVSLPFRAVPVISSKTQDVSLSCSYEYVDMDSRQSHTSEMVVNIPLHQPDRFEISEPTVAYEGFVGEDTSISLEYVNKGKSPISNVEAKIEGDIDSDNSFVRVGNIESGKSGSIAFSVRPMLEGDNNVIITITYEDSNGETQERIFETTMTAMAMEPFDPGEFEEPIEPVEEKGGAVKWIVGTILVIAAIVTLVIIRKRRKKAKKKAEEALLEDWDEDNEE